MAGVQIPSNDHLRIVKLPVNLNRCSKVEKIKSSALQTFLSVLDHEGNLHLISPDSGLHLDIPVSESCSSLMPSNVDTHVVAISHQSRVLRGLLQVQID